MTPTPARLAALPAAVALLALLSACTGSVSGSEGTATSAGPSRAPAAAQDSGRMPGGGVTGEIAAVSDALLQVQGDDGQTAVTWDDGTAITQTVAAALSDVAVGSCVVVSGADGSGTAATGVAVTPASDGSCGGFGVGGGSRPDGGGVPDGGERPEGMPTDVPSGGPGGSRPDGAPTGMPEGGGSGGFALTAGLVTAVDGTTITVEQTVPGAADATTTTVTVDDATTYTATVTADASAFVVGRCVVAQGEADDSGKVAAAALTVSDAGDDGCTSGFAPRGGRMPGGAPGQDGETADA